MALDKDKLASTLGILMEFSLYCFAILLPYTTKWANGSILAMCAFALFSAAPAQKLGHLRGSKGLLLLPLYFILLCVGVLYSDDSKQSIAVLERSLVFLGGPLLIATSRPFPKRVFTNAAWIFTMNVTAASVYCIIRNIIWFREHNIQFNRFFDWEYTYRHLSEFVGLHPTYFSIFLLTSIYILVFLAEYHTTRQRILNVFLICFLCAFLIMLGTKIGLVILFLFANAAFIVYLRKRKKFSLVFGYVALNLVLVTIGLNTHVVYWRFRMAYETLKNTINGTEMSDYRILHWRCAIQAIREKPFLGWGTGDTYTTLDNCYVEMKMPELIGYNAHNQFLESWIKVGLPGMLVVVLALIYPIYVSARNRHYLFLSIFSMFFLIAFTESVLSVQKGIALFTVISSVYLGHICTREARPKGTLV